MSLLEIMWIIGAIVVIGLLVWVYLAWKREKRDLEEISFVAVLIVIAIVVCLVINLMAYNGAVAIPYEYRALINDVDDMEEYLMRYENVSGDGFGSIGQGLESLEYKQELQQAIKDRNEKHADICALLNNFWTPYKDIIISGLPPGDYGCVIISE